MEKEEKGRYSTVHYRKRYDTLYQISAYSTPKIKKIIL
jgi:hypothetical protein